jgi:hypothetical protein
VRRPSRSGGGRPTGGRAQDAHHGGRGLRALVSSRSLALQLTVVVPMAKIDPDVGRQLGVGWVMSSPSLTRDSPAGVTSTPLGLVAFTGSLLERHRKWLACICHRLVCARAGALAFDNRRSKMVRGRQ